MFAAHRRTVPRRSALGKNHNSGRFPTQLAQNAAVSRALYPSCAYVVAELCSGSLSGNVSVSD